MSIIIIIIISCSSSSSWWWCCLCCDSSVIDNHGASPTHLHYLRLSARPSHTSSRPSSAPSHLCPIICCCYWCWMLWNIPSLLLYMIRGDWILNIGAKIFSDIFHSSQNEKDDNSPTFHYTFSQITKCWFSYNSSFHLPSPLVIFSFCLLHWYIHRFDCFRWRMNFSIWYLGRNLICYKSHRFVFHS